jgi:hypothetical protein
MYEFKAIPEITKEWILERITQEEIFERYLGCPVRLNTFFRSPIRKDKNPTCTFKWFKGVLRYRDWSEPVTRDCFDIVQYIYRCSFWDALQIIARDFKLANVQPKHDPYIRRSDDEARTKGDKAVIQIKPQIYTPTDVDFFKSFHIPFETCKKYKVFGISAIWLNSKPVYRYSIQDPAIGYFLGLDEQENQKWKIYFYRRRGVGVQRFLCNTNRIQGWVQLPDKGSILVLTKSMKDVMVLDRLGIPAIAMQNETTMPYDYIIDNLRQRFDHLFTLYDFDRAGILTANKIKRAYGIQPLFLFNGRFGSKNYKAKDISDFMRDFGVEETKKLVVSVAEILSLKNILNNP